MWQAREVVTLLPPCARVNSIERVETSQEPIELSIMSTMSVSYIHTHITRALAAASRSDVETSSDSETRCPSAHLRPCHSAQEETTVRTRRRMRESRGHRGSQAMDEGRSRFSHLHAPNRHARPQGVSCNARRSTVAVVRAPHRALDRGPKPPLPQLPRAVIPRSAVACRRPASRDRCHPRRTWGMWRISTALSPSVRTRRS